LRQHLKNHSMEIYGVIFLFVSLTLMAMVNVTLFSLLLFALAYAWPLALSVPGSWEKVQTRKYRLSFYRFIFFIDQKFLGFVVRKYPGRMGGQTFQLLRSLYPIVCVLIFTGFTIDINLLFTLLGAMTFNLFYFTWIKFTEEAPRLKFY
jgi:apolipoprotein N-acyltransferase